jgi:hypothetical protein
MFFRRILKRSSQYNIISLVAAVAEQRGSNEAERREKEKAQKGSLCGNMEREHKLKSRSQRRYYLSAFSDER